MLDTPAIFPDLGSYALHQEAGTTHLVRIHQHKAKGLVLVSYPARTGASGNRTLELADLLDGTPLNEAERAEMAALAKAVEGRRKSKRLEPQFDRLNALLMRDFYAHVIDNLARAAGCAPVQQAAA